MAMWPCRHRPPGNPRFRPDDGGRIRSTQLLVRDAHEFPRGSFTPPRESQVPVARDPRSGSGPSIARSAGEPPPPPGRRPLEATRTRVSNLSSYRQVRPERANATHTSPDVSRVLALRGLETRARVPTWGPPSGPGVSDRARFRTARIIVSPSSPQRSVFLAVLAPSNETSEVHGPPGIPSAISHKCERLLPKLPPGVFGRDPLAEFPSPSILG